MNRDIHRFSEIRKYEQRFYSVKQNVGTIKHLRNFHYFREEPKVDKTLQAKTPSAKLAKDDSLFSSQVRE